MKEYRKKAREENPKTTKDSESSQRDHDTHKMQEVSGNDNEKRQRPSPIAKDLDTNPLNENRDEKTEMGSCASIVSL